MSAAPAAAAAPAVVERGASQRAAERIVCAIDTGGLDEARTLARKLAGAVGLLKVGLQFYVAHGAAGANALAEAHGAPVFLDLKFHDIPNTVAGAVRSAAAAAAPAMLTVHAAGGAAMMRAAADAAGRIADRAGARPRVLAVTVLTSFDESDAAAAGMAGRIGDIVRRAAALAQECGLDGAVASARETAALRADRGPDFTLVAPGVRPGRAPADDQKRVATPAEAIRRGADYLVIGRPIIRAADPAAAARRIAAEMAGPP